MKQIKVKNNRKINFKNFIYRERGVNGEYLQTDTNKKYKKPVVDIQQSISKGRSKIEQKAKRDTYSASDYKYNDLKSKITNSSDRTIKSYIKKPYVDPATGFTKTHDELAPQVEMSGRDPLLGTIVDLYTGNKFINAGFKTANYFADKFANALAKRFLYNTAEPTVRYATPEELAIFNGTIQKSNNESLIQPFSRTINANTKQIGQVTKQLEKKNQGQFLLPILKPNEFAELNYQIDNKIKIPFIHLQGLVSPKQLNAFNITKDPKYLDVKRILSGIKKQYFETYDKFYKPKIRIEKPTQEKMLEYMREKNIHPRFEYETFNHIRTLTPNQHEGDAVQKMATINKPLGESQIALIGKKNQKMLTVKKPISREQIYKEVIKTKRNRKYKDYGPRIKSVKLSRKTLQ